MLSWAIVGATFILLSWAILGAIVILLSWAIVGATVILLSWAILEATVILLFWAILGAIVILLSWAILGATVILSYCTGYRYLAILSYCRGYSYLAILSYCRGYSYLGIFFSAARQLVVAPNPLEDSRSHSDTPHPVGLLWTRYQPDQRPLPNNTPHTHQTNIIASGENRTRNPIKQAIADPRLRPRGHLDRQEVLQLRYMNEDNSEEISLILPLADKSALSETSVLFMQPPDFCKLQVIFQQNIWQTFWPLCCCLSFVI